MRVAETNWMQLAGYLKHDDRAVIPLGSTEQHGYLSLGTDAILAERVAVEAAEPLGVPVFPALPYGITPYFLAFPGSVSLRVSSYMAVLTDMLNSLAGQGFKRFLLVNGHGGNSSAGSLAAEWMAANPETRVVFFSWYNAPHTFEVVQAVDQLASHGSWMENFPWNRVAAVPGETKAMIDTKRLQSSPPAQVRELIGDGNYGGAYQKPDEDMLRIWQVAVEETRDMINGL
jgi:creatinine amidohydrolase